MQVEIVAVDEVVFVDWNWGCVVDAVPVRTASELPYRLQDFELRMFYAVDIAQPSAEVGKQVSLLWDCLAREVKFQT